MGELTIESHMFTEACELNFQLASKPVQNKTVICTLSACTVVALLGVALRISKTPWCFGGT